jgi:hypothetical protein
MGVTVKRALLHPVNPVRFPNYDSSGVEKSGRTSILPDQDSHFPATIGTTALVGILFLIDIDAPVNVTAFKKNSEKFLFFRHHSPITCQAQTRLSISHRIISIERSFQTFQGFHLRFFK